MPHQMHCEERQSLIAGMALKYCNGSARKTESLFGWEREMVNTGLAEKRHPEAAEVICKLAESHAQQDSSFLTEMAVTRLTAKEALNLETSVDHGF